MGRAFGAGAGASRLDALALWRLWDFSSRSDQLPLQRAGNEEVGVLAQSSYLFAERRDLSFPLGPEQDAEDSADSQPCIRGAPSGIAIVKEREVSATFHSEGKSLGFAHMEARAEISRHGPQKGIHPQPAVAERLIEQSCRLGMPQLNQLLPDGEWHQYGTELIP